MSGAATSTYGITSGGCVPGVTRYTSTIFTRPCVTSGRMRSRTAPTSAPSNAAPVRAAAIRCGVGRDASLPIAVVVARNQIGRRQHLFDRRVEPAIDAVPNQLAADQQHEHRGDQRHAEQHRDELSAESRERQRAPPLDDQLDDVAREHEREAEQNREVRRPQAVQDEFGEEVGRQARPTGWRARRCPTSAASSRIMPARMSRGLSRSGRRGGAIFIPSRSADP